MVEQIDTPGSTRDRLLAAAERLLLSERYEEVSVRGICAAADANSAAVHYHFGSKDALVGALIEDRLGALWDTRLTELTARGASVPEVVDAVIEPFVELAADPVGRLHLRLLAHLVFARRAEAFSLPWFRLDTWGALPPALGERETQRRWMLAFDLIIMRFGTVGSQGFELSTGAVATLRDFVVAGLTAPRGENR